MSERRVPETQPGTVIWLTGIPAAGKSTVAEGLIAALRERAVPVELLDSDTVRAFISPDLRYSPEARDQNTKRLAFIAQLLARNGVWTVIAAVSSQRRFRDRARAMVERFVEVWVKCPVQVCQRRDPKGLYKKAAEGLVSDIAGLHQPYEEPLNPEVVLETDEETPQDSVNRLLSALNDLGYLD
ncbi:MAG: adenylyl-sulfate kinase [Armatimonadota bacterium]